MDWDEFFLSDPALDEEHLGRRDRLRLRVVEEGLESLHDYEVIEFLLYYVERRGDTNPIAHKIINHFGSLGKALCATKADLCAVEGLGDGAAEWLATVNSLIGEYLAESKKAPDAVKTLRDVRGVARKWLPPATPVWQLCLSGHGALLCTVPLGGIGDWGRPDALRDALGAVIRTSASGVVLVQYRPRLPMAPTAYDLDRDHAYAETLRAVDVRLLDHVLICGDAVYSLAHSGQLPVLQPWAAPEVEIWQTYRPEP